MKKIIALSLLSAVILSGCGVTGEQYKASTYQVSALNQKQEAKTINIIAVTPAKVQVDNKEAKKDVAAVGGFLGSIAGAFIGNNQGETLVGGVLGGVTGGASSMLVSDKVMVDAVSLTYSENNKIYTSTQVGQACEFKPGVALVISTQANETRVQPNSVCKES
ncbi:hypothetical protein [Photobacterium carnosum]|uniref:Glycine zipper 2TM domain-containing protein n=1 Tax=Photobacterium carnosum TaxID=2023717 RepID=A0A2N4URX9_9GAMM|nr:hypothetical protein [Photobacterium carnosum]KAE8178203.1 hypothetical protein CIT27_00025 [Photobacterium carnosum]MBY3789248.1 hypothetical protein [Photobacterium carnosum]MCD9495414.1 hypothetical protein [Photobacterium carnosum]MCD9498368.1 hypothetical protein [Photobacterium carnosum]MCD9523532.1 hypothetical protein [Photobacterium carnosum]